ncbi:MAG TPA: hypothetical protein VKB34_14240 [Povalibacter sp.]|nr:hypothetical protein [Povalibacter sp.]
MSSPDPHPESNGSRRVQEGLQALDTPAVTSASHDEQVLAKMHGAARRIQSRHSPRRTRWPFALAASFLLGVALTLVVDRAVRLRPPAPAISHLTIPASVALRGAGGTAEIPVEQADPAVWYRYIQELLYAGEREEALEHLRRFNELHPDYVHEP